MRIEQPRTSLAAGTSWFGATIAARQQASRIDFASRPASSIRYLKASNAGEDDRLGRGDPLVGVGMAMSADGNTLAVTSPHEDGGATGVNGNQKDESAWDAGAVYVFVRSGGRWTRRPISRRQMPRRPIGSGSRCAERRRQYAGGWRNARGQRRARHRCEPGRQLRRTRRARSTCSRAPAPRGRSRPTSRRRKRGRRRSVRLVPALSNNGNTLAVGAQGEGSAATGINSNREPTVQAPADAGAAYVFVRSGSM